MVSSVREKKKKRFERKRQKKSSKKKVKNCFLLTSAMRRRMYLDIHIMSPASMPTQGPTWYSCFWGFVLFSRKREREKKKR